MCHPSVTRVTVGDTCVNPVSFHVTVGDTCQFGVIQGDCGGHTCQPGVIWGDCGAVGPCPRVMSGFWLGRLYVQMEGQVRGRQLRSKTVADSRHTLCQSLTSTDRTFFKMKHFQGKKPSHIKRPLPCPSGLRNRGWP